MPSTRHRYVALLRAINVGGHSVVTMAKLRALFERFGAREVSTYIQSGNVLFTATEANREKLARALEAHLSRALKTNVRAFLFARAELEKAAAGNPFEPARHEKVQRCHLMFLDAEPSATSKKALMALQCDDYRFHVRGRVLYFAYSKALQGKRRNVDFERVLGVVGTARTWKVVEKLVELAGE
jgi:uncharacterized protein (DUF1697 family)